MDKCNTTSSTFSLAWLSAKTDYYLICEKEYEEKPQKLMIEVINV